MERAYMSSGKVKGKSDSNNFGFEEDHSFGTSWPAKQCYTCSFCNRQFRSAQALGGHMNVHRRDRARLRLLPSPVSESQNPNPKFNPNPVFAESPSSSSAKFLPHTHHHLPSLSVTLSSLSSASTDDERKLVISLPQLDPLSPQVRDITNKKRIRSVLGFGELNGFAQKNKPKVYRKESLVSLDLEIGLLKDQKEDLDLELRLGWF